MAGIKLAHDLSKEGMKFILLEASDYIGGRIKSLDLQGAIVEEGANWIHGWENEKKGSKNPIATLAEKVDLETIDESDPTYILRDPTQRGKIVTKNLDDAYEELYESIEAL